MARKTRLVTKNGKDLPAEFRDLPAGRYVVEAVDNEAPALSSEEEAGIEAALESYRQGRVVKPTTVTTPKATATTLKSRRSSRSPTSSRHSTDPSWRRG